MTRTDFFWLGGTVLAVGLIAWGMKEKVIPAITAGKTWDPATDKRIATLHPLIRDKVRAFINAADKAGYKLRVTSGHRDYKEQQKLYDKGRKTPGPKVTNSKPGDSLHNFGLAVDVVEIKNGKALYDNPAWSKIAAIGKKHGFQWGGDWTSFKDMPHFEYKFGKTLAQIRTLYNSGKVQNGYVAIV